MGALQQKNCGRAGAGGAPTRLLTQWGQDKSVALSLASDLDLHSPAWAPAAGAGTGHIKAENKVVYNSVHFRKLRGQGKARPVFSSAEIDTIRSFFSLTKKKGGPFFFEVSLAYFC